MSVPPNRLIVLETGVLVNLARGNDTGRKLDARFGLSARPERPLLCSVVEGEMLGLAASWGWGKAKVSALQGLFAQLVRFSAGHPAVVTAYTAGPFLGTDLPLKMSDIGRVLTCDR